MKCLLFAVCVLDFVAIAALSFAVAAVFYVNDHLFEKGLILVIYFAAAATVISYLKVLKDIISRVDGKEDK